MNESLVAGQIERMAVDSNLWLHERQVRVHRFDERQWVVIQHDKRGRAMVSDRRLAKSVNEVIHYVKVLEREIMPLRRVNGAR
jgi:hypothetical protein